MWICQCFNNQNLFLGFRKKLEKLSKQKNCELISEWQKSIINYLYWCVSTTPDDDSELVQARCMSLDNYVHDIHRRHCKKNSKMLTWKIAELW